MNTGTGALWLLLCLAVHGAAIGLVPLVGWHKGRTRRQGAAALLAGLGGNAGVYALAHWACFPARSPWRTWQLLACSQLPAQQLEGLALVALACGLASPALGWLLRRMQAGRAGAWPLPRQRRQLALLAQSAVFAAALLTWFAGASAVNRIAISEVCAKNTAVALGEGALPSDYVELYNPGGLPCGLEGCYLSDDEEQLKRLPLEGLEVPAKGYLVIPVSQEETDFGLSRKGETVYFSQGAQVLAFVRYPALEENQAYACGANGAWVLQACTPGAANDRPLLAQPVFSAPSGFYDEAFSLTITAPAGTVVYYTLDGSVPDETDAVYTGPIAVYDRSAEPNRWRAVRQVTAGWREEEPQPLPPVDKAFILRAVAVDETGERSPVTTATYWVNLPQYQQQAVVSLVGDPWELFGPDGIYVTGSDYEDYYKDYLAGKDMTGREIPLPNFYKRGPETEREIALLLLDGSLRIEQQAGMRVQGGSSRGVALKRLAVYARKEYGGSSVFDAQIFPGVESHSFVLRKTTEPDVANALVGAVIPQRDIGGLLAEPVYVFLNGEFWYDTFLTEKYSGTYFEQTYGVSGDNVVMISAGEVDVGQPEDIALYREIYDFLAGHDLAQPEDYQAFGQLVDIDNYIRYFAANIYLCNIDLGETKNCCLWRVRQPGGGGYTDGRWRWLLYDLDAYAWDVADWYGVESMAQVNTFAWSSNVDGPLNTRAVYAALKANPAFCQQFVLAFMDMVNTVFAPQAVAQAMAPWGYDLSWNDSFYVERPQYITAYLAEEFGLTGSLQPVCLAVSDPAGGTLKINTALLEMEQGSWQGSYYTDYPVTVTAVANPGWRFAGWSGAAQGQQATVSVPVQEGGIELYAVFEQVDS